MESLVKLVEQFELFELVELVELAELVEFVKLKILLTIRKEGGRGKLNLCYLHIYVIHAEIIVRV